MRRLAVTALIANAILLSALFIPYRSARTQPGDAPRAAGVGRAGQDATTADSDDPFGSAAAPWLDLADFGLGEVLEGDGPPLERFAPDALPDAPEATSADDIPAPEGYPVDFKTKYPRPEEINAFLDALEENHPELVEVYDIGRSWQDRPIRVARVASEKLGDDIAGRPAMYIDGQHHARELISSQVALYTLWWLVHFYGRDPLATHLVDTRALYVNPSVNVDGNAIVLDNAQAMRKTANPTCCDDDGDGAADEDYSVGYGYGTDSVSIYEFDQAWADQYPDDPFQEGWRQHLIGQPRAVGRFTGALGGPRQAIEQRDMDGDGRRGEDEVGGTDPNRNYDIFWENGDTRIQSEAFRGPAVWSERETHAVRDFLATIDHLATAISYHSGVDLILFPWGYSETDELPDAALYELLSRKGSQLTEVNGIPGSQRTWTARGLYSASGSTMDYIYARLGAMAWSPETYGGSSRTRIERAGATGAFTVGTSTGFGFNPRPEQILPWTDRWNRYALYLLAAAPNVEIDSLTIQGGDLLVRVGNDGTLPITLTLAVTDPAGATRAWAETDDVLHNGQVTFAVPLDRVRGGPLELKLTAVLATGTRPHEVETAAWAFRVTDAGEVRLESGRLVPFVDLGGHFGGWWAGDEWNAPRYRCPSTAQTCPPEIPASPPPTPDPNRAPIRARTSPLTPTTPPTAPPTTPSTRWRTLFLPALYHE